VTSVAVCIPTFRRPDLLSRLLESLVRVDPAGARITVVVVDNDPTGSARTAVEGYRARFPALVYEVEDEPGISAARNRLVQLALQASADFVCFIDDDEWVDEQWLRQLLATVSAFAADVVLGPVLTSYENTTPAWLREGRFFERPRFATGSPVGVARTGNSMVAARLFEAHADNFPRSLPIAEDTYFFERARRNGAAFVWCDEALVYEPVAAERARVGWLLSRAYHQGKMYSQCLVLLGQSRSQLALRGIQCVARLGQAALLLLPSAALGRAAALRSARRAVGALGGLVGLTWRPPADDGI
jgi:succinoglycan biosynthesis protein ExoM